MPYEMKKSGSEYEVINKQTGKSKGKSKSKEMAKAHMRAMYAHESFNSGLNKKSTGY